jgi:SanA protein
MSLTAQHQRFLSLVFLFVLSILLGWFWGADWLIRANAVGKVFDSALDCPKAEIALVLGTAPTGRYGGINPYFAHRISAAAELYHAGKVKFILVSGDNSKKIYDEPTAMKNALIMLGVPPDRIFLDHAGFRTLDSMERALKVFGQKNLVVVSQRFHNERAIYLGEHFGMTVYGYNAQDVALREDLKTKARERLARMKVFWDILFGINSKYLGAPVKIS